MIRENLAERLYCDLKNAGIKIENPHYDVNGSRIGDYPNIEQIHLSCLKNKYAFTKGLACDHENNHDTLTKAYNELLEYVKSLGTIKFYNLVLPKNCVIDVSAVEYDKVISRYIKDYLPQCDEVLERWDLLIQKC